MNQYAALDVSLEQTAICVVDETGRKLAEAKVVTCPDAILTWLRDKTATLMKVGMECGPLAVWLWNELSRRGLPIVCLDARHASAALRMMPNKPTGTMPPAFTPCGRPTRHSATARSRLILSAAPFDVFDECALAGTLGAD